MKMKRKRGDAGLATSCGTTGASSSGASKTRGKPSKEKPKATRRKTGPSLTATRVANIIGQLDNKRGSTMESIRSKLIRSGHAANTPLIRHALERAVRAGLLREIREERFSLPRTSVSGSSSSSSSSSGRAQNKGVTRVANLGKRAAKLSPSAARSGSKGDDKRRQRRRLQGRRHANADNGGSADGDEGRDLRDDDDAGAGEGDVDDQVGDVGDKEDVSNRVNVNVTEPVAGCDAVMVFGTH